MVDSVHVSHVSGLVLRNALCSGRPLLESLRRVTHRWLRCRLWWGSEQLCFVKSIDYYRTEMCSTALFRAPRSNPTDSLATCCNAHRYSFYSVFQGLCLLNYGQITCIRELGRAFSVHLLAWSRWGRNWAWARVGETSPATPSHHLWEFCGRERLILQSHDLLISFCLHA